MQIPSDASDDDSSHKDKILLIVCLVAATALIIMASGLVFVLRKTRRLAAQVHALKVCQ